MVGNQTLNVVHHPQQPQQQQIHILKEETDMDEKVNATMPFVIDSGNNSFPITERRR